MSDEAGAALDAKAARELDHFVTDDKTVAFPIPAVVGTAALDR